MRDYGKVFCSFWSSETTRGLSEDGRTLALYLLTSPHTNMIGVFRLPDGYICEDLQWTPERVSEGFQNCSEAGFATRCEKTKWVMIDEYLIWNPIENPNQAKSARKLFESIPGEFPEKPAISGAIATLCRRFEDKLPPDFFNPFETLPKPFQNQEQEQEQEQEQDNPPNPPGGGKVVSAGNADQVREVFDHWVAVMGKKSSAKLSADRRRKIQARFREGYTVDQLKQAVSGCAASAYHMGRDPENNPNGTVYDDLELICRSGSKVEQFIQKLDSAPVREVML